MDLSRDGVRLGTASRHAGIDVIAPKCKSPSIGVSHHFNLLSTCLCRYLDLFSPEYSRIGEVEFLIPN